MNLPVSSEYLAIALAAEKALADMSVKQRRITDLHLPTGQLIAADVIFFADALPFDLPLPCGVFPVILSVAHFSDDQRVAFASVRFRESTPVAWDMLTVDGQDISKLEKGHFFGYGVDAGTGCFIDASAAKILGRRMAAVPETFPEMMTAMERTYVPTWQWLDMPVEKGNLVAFSTGFGDGAYATYAGFDAAGEISVVVTDFSVVPWEAT